ncbi:MAG: glutamine--fructose-6-phosphate transaminase (isomerizing) [Syntrophomonadaceae bacterium]|nr:glutamine--fructose-6-phosphate transaminase (isomerizing) [Syntrophomonadaceae bacterium]
MCGIMGYIGKGNATELIIDGLSKLEYRGYDSAGIALYIDDELRIVKKKGRLADTINCLGKYPVCDLGIGHTRWATHGIPSDYNAHPHTDCKSEIAVVHNGIIENYAQLRKNLILEGHDFVSETDTEVIIHLIEKFYQPGCLEAAVRKALSQVKGSFAIAVISKDEPDKIITAKKDSPLIIGLGNGENYVASDIPAILGKTNQVYILEDGQFAVLTQDSVELTDFQGRSVEKKLFNVPWDPIAAEKSGYEHFMIKEIHEQPEAIRQTLRGKLHNGAVDFSDLGLDDMLSQVNKIYIVACGTAYHAGLIGKAVIEKLARIPVETDIASEFRYRNILWNPNDLMVVISQSGETADTLAALREARRNGIKVLAVTNVVGSSIAREADKVIYTHAGPEIAVASTKAYSTQLVIMYLLALHLSGLRGTMKPGEINLLINELSQIDQRVEQVLGQQPRLKELAQKYKDVQSTFFLGRGFDYSVAMEGALKLKEISYIHAEAYAAGELKHGPLALIHENVPVLALITQDHLVEKSMSNIKEVKARGAVVVAVCKENLQESCQECDEQILLPNVSPVLAPIVSVVPLQLFAYYMAVLRGTDVDKPRNLAKSVTVE